ncbi:DUF1513 domain-containing protein [Hoeflea sp. TYP-13]|uniref:DUF1513 domain-containing protein n=1 Tax=Hoeflea sp. TYP-13 TaxID=3230023 RepID=UPI0034C64A76
MAGEPVSRRDFLKAAGLGFAASLSPAGAEELSRADAVFASAYSDKAGGFGAALLSEDGAVIASIPLPVRGHDVAHHHESGRAVAFARRPGTVAVAFDTARNAPPRNIMAAPGRHFYGHGVYSPDGRLLYASENDFDNAAGMIGIYDVGDGYRRIGELTSGGTGPHDMVLLGNGRSLAIANGGIETHPDFGRTKLNLATMEPCLCFVDCVHGTLLERQSLPKQLHQLSIRHLARIGHNGVYFACQYEGSQQDHPPLCGHAEPGSSIRLFETEPGALAKLKNYIGSVAADPQRGTLAITSPRGNCLLILDGKTGSVLRESNLANVCGVAEGHRGYRATTGNGAIFDTAKGTISNGSLQWDNHLLRISG